MRLIVRKTCLAKNTAGRLGMSKPDRLKGWDQLTIKEQDSLILLAAHDIISFFKFSADIRLDKSCEDTLFYTLVQSEHDWLGEEGRVRRERWILDHAAKSCNWALFARLRQAFGRRDGMTFNGPNVDPFAD